MGFRKKWTGKWDLDPSSKPSYLKSFMTGVQYTRLERFSEDLFYFLTIQYSIFKYSSYLLLQVMQLEKVLSYFLLVLLLEIILNKQKVNQHCMTIKQHNRISCYVVCQPSQKCLDKGKHITTFSLLVANAAEQYS